MNKTHKTRKHTMRKRKTRKMYGGTVEELNKLLKELVVDNKLHIPPLSEEQRIEFKNVKKIELRGNWKWSCWALSKVSALVH